MMSPNVGGRLVIPLNYRIQFLQKAWARTKALHQQIVVSFKRKLYAFLRLLKSDIFEKI